MSEIDDVLCLAAAGIPAARHGRYVKGFRLREFGRCPVCDERGMRTHGEGMLDPFDGKRRYWCESCGFGATIDLWGDEIRGRDDIPLRLVDLAEEWSNERADDRR